MKQFFVTLAGVFAGLVLFLIVAPIVLFSLVVSAGSDRGPVTPAAAVLALDLRTPFEDQPSRSAFGLGAPSTLDVVRTLEAAGKDRRVKGVYVRANMAGMSSAQAEELRTAFTAFQAEGKFVVAHIQPDLMTTSLPGYVAIAAADEIWLQPSSYFGPTGLAIESEFLGGAVEKFGLRAQILQREEYKGGAEYYTAEAFSTPVRENLGVLLGGISETLIAHMAGDRELPAERARALIAETPLPAEAALEAKLVDQLGFPEDAERAALERGGERAEFLEFAMYQPAPSGGGPVIAIVTGEGPILSGPAEESLFPGPAIMNSDEVAQAIDEAAESDARAIVFRVNSPGGTLIASDQIHAAVARAKAAGKPVVVSMGPVAASGGYWVSANANEIVALPTTITGSIGIYGGKVSFGDALERYTGITTDRIVSDQGSPLVLWASPAEPFTNAEQAFVNRTIQEGYDSFLARVADGRELTPEQLGGIAGGRVWTGARAKELGLVDHLGGLDVAVARARALADLDDGPVSLQFFPGQRSPIEELQDLLGVSAEAARAAAVLGRLMGDERAAALLRQAAHGERIRGPMAQAPPLSAE